MEIFYEMTAPGGFIVVSNFAPRNPLRFFIDYFLDENLEHRTLEAQRLVEQTRSTLLPFGNTHFEQIGSCASLNPALNLVTGRFPDP